MNDIAVDLRDVSIRFNMAEEKLDNMKEFIIKAIKRELQFKEFWALKNISFQIKKGERVGILGLNGSGKSVLLKTIAGVLKPTTGDISVNGTLAPLIELGAGFDPDYSGRENIFLNGAVLGYSKKFILERLDNIVEFAELEDFIDTPLKNYSSGMRARLGFSIATLVEPEILIVDEVLAVGDHKFRKKSESKMLSMFDSGTTVLFVSHSINQVRRLCNRAIWLHEGKIVMDGDVKTVSEEYERKS